MGRLIAAIILLVLLAAGVLSVWPQVANFELLFPFAQAVSLRGLGVAAAVALVILSVLLSLLIKPIRGFLSALIVILMLFTIANTAIIVTRGAGNTAFAEPAPTDITVGSWNTLGDSVDADDIAAFAVDNNLRVLSLPETTEVISNQVAARIAALGGPTMAVHHVAFDSVYRARSTGLLIDVSIGNYAITESKTEGTSLPSFVATPTSDTALPTIVAVHAIAPMLETMQPWRDDLAWVEQQCARPNTILAGDFNATVDHFPADSKCSDAALETGNAAFGTWPSSIPSLLGAPIDHVLYTSEWKATGMNVIQSFDDAGSDHRPIVAQLSRR
ncbi:endonuclease/exonuclease/phosphatase family protein [Lysinibacter cavernae]|uniref:Endonuclease/exonuclease/phosphatase (EEP) superfamily protein YafD n=1 Tax=Lysinibacter cavernae TaxID=1640652 RepID=A0A7X5QYI7_9MICO|nr:endonuclease/exonuclease/phosphatase family protein [Lysinibacter cavernae]NIH52349.1 endonuclease/exonuclease/phosphatase (EEP) superfamily protein YafD [Lysinibacter cavernae]